MSQNTLLLLQSVSHGLQLANAQIAVFTHNAVLAAIIAIAIAMFGHYVQSLGNQSVPPPKAQDPPKQPN